MCIRDRPRADLIQAIRLMWGLSIDEIRVRYDKFIREKAEEVLKIRTINNFDVGFDTIFSYSISDRGRFTEEEIDDEMLNDYHLDMTDAREGKNRKYPFPPFL